jgi:hypothetical protein
MDLGALDYLPKTEGYGSIIQRISEAAAAKRSSRAEPVVDSDVPEDPPEEQAYCEQLRTLSRSLVDVLHLAGLNESLPDAARYALGSAQRIAEDIQRLSGPESQAASKEEIPHGR